MSLKNKQKYENLQFHITRWSSSADENHVTRTKAPEKLLNGPCGEIELFHWFDHNWELVTQFILKKQRKGMMCEFHLEWTRTQNLLVGWSRATISDWSARSPCSCRSLSEFRYLINTGILFWMRAVCTRHLVLSAQWRRRQSKLIRSAENKYCNQRCDLSRGVFAPAGGELTFRCCLTHRRHQCPQVGRRAQVWSIHVLLRNREIRGGGLKTQRPKNQLRSDDTEEQ